MQTYSSSVSAKGQVTIPAEVRERLGIKPHDVITFEVSDGDVRLRPAAYTLETAYQSVPPLSRPISDDKELVRIAKEEHAARTMRKLREQ